MTDESDNGIIQGICLLNAGSCHESKDVSIGVKQGYLGHPLSSSKPSLQERNLRALGGGRVTRR